MGPPPEHDMTAEDLAALRAEYESGASALSALSARFSLSRAALTRIARTMNFGARPPVEPFQRRGETPHNRAPRQARLAAAKSLVTKTSTGKASAKKCATKKTSTKTSAAKSGAAPKQAARKPKTLKPTDGALSQTCAADAAPLDIQALAGKLRHAAERELVKINDQLEAGGDVERRARVLASLVKTLGDLARLADARDASTLDDASGWSLDDLRATLARRIDALAPDGAPE